MALAAFVVGHHNGRMSDTVLLSLITAASAICVAAIGAYDRHQLHRQGINEDQLVAGELAKHKAS